MDTNISSVINSLESSEINVLLDLYFNKEGISKKFKESNFKKETIQGLIDKHLIDANLGADEDILSLTSEGLSICGSVMFERINEKKEQFFEKIKEFPERAVATLIKRIMWKDDVSKESGLSDQLLDSYSVDKSNWYEKVLLNDETIVNILEKLYNVLDSIGFIKRVDGQSWCSPEVESFLKDGYKDMMDLTWLEEDSLKYYFFFYVYAQGQKNLINFAGEGLEYRSMFFAEDSNSTDYYLKSNLADPRALLSSLGISESRIIGFLKEMEKKEIVSERYYPLSSFAFFSEEDKIFVIKDIKKYMNFIKKKFLKHVVDSLLD